MQFLLLLYSQECLLPINLTPVEMMKLSAGDVAGEKSIKTLSEVISDLNNDPDITKRFGQKGLGTQKPWTRIAGTA